MQTVAKKAPAARKTKIVHARILNDDGDLVMGEVEVDISDKRPEVRKGQRLTPDFRDAREGNPGKNGSGPVELDE